MSVPVEDSQRPEGAEPILVADDTPTLARYRNDGYALIGGGILFSVIIVGTLAAAQRNQGSLFCFCWRSSAKWNC